MARLFDNQANLYAIARPSYPPSLFSFLSSLTSTHRLAWDVGTGNGQAAAALAQHYEKVVGTDLSSHQLKYAHQLPNVTYHCTPVRMSAEELHNFVGPEGSVDLVTVAQALHWFDLDMFYAQVKHVLRKPGGVFAAWCYTVPAVSPSVDAVFMEFYARALPYFEPARQLVDDEYRNLQFPFEPVGEDGSGTDPIRFEITKEMTLPQYITYINTWSALQTARSKGVELLGDDVQNALKDVWGSLEEVRTVTYPVFLRVGTVPA